MKQRHRRRQFLTKTLTAGNLRTVAQSYVIFAAIVVAVVVVVVGVVARLKPAFRLRHVGLKSVLKTSVIPRSLRLRFRKLTWTPRRNK